MPATTINIIIFLFVVKGHVKKNWLHNLLIINKYLFVVNYWLINFFQTLLTWMVLFTSTNTCLILTVLMFQCMVSMWYEWYDRFTLDMCCSYTESCCTVQKSNVGITYTILLWEVNVYTFFWQRKKITLVW